MSAKSSYGSQYAGAVAPIVVGAIGGIDTEATLADITGLVSGADYTITTPVYPAGVYAVNSGIRVNASNLLTVSSRVEFNSATTGIHNLAVATGAVLTDYRANFSTFVNCDGVNPIELVVSATTSAGAWIIDSGSYYEVVRIA